MTLPPPRARFWGQVAVLTWYLGGFLLILVCTVTQTGPSAWLAAWQLRNWGGDNVMLSIVPQFGVLMLPLIGLALLPRRPDWPFVYGAKEAIWPRDRPASAAPPPEHIIHRMRSAQRIVTGLAACCLLAGAAVSATGRAASRQRLAATDYLPTQPGAQAQADQHGFALTRTLFKVNGTGPMTRLEPGTNGSIGGARIVIER